jgi:signal transduction histidine kinase/CheY-like chemotaxis protein
VSLKQTFLDWVRDGTPRDTDPATSIRVLIQHVVWAVLVSLGSCYIAVFALTGVYRASLFIALILAIGTTALLQLTRRGKPRQGGRWLALILYVDIFAAMVGRGGIEGHAAAWMLAVPLIAGLMVDLREAMRFGLASIAAYWALWAVEHVGGVGFESEVPIAYRRFMPLFDYPTMVLLQLAIIWGLNRVWTVMNQELSERNQDLLRENERRIQAESEARASAAARYTFLATMSHEIRTPLNGILGLTESLVGGELNPTQTHLAQTIHRSGNLLRTLLDDVLSFSRVESGHLEVELQAVSPRNVGQEVRSLWHATAISQGVSLRFEPDPSLPFAAMLDRQKLTQILGNLVCNAIKFSPHGGDVTLSAGVQDGALRFAVSDHGQGIGQDQLAQIFEPFQQGDGSSSRRFGGAGLGLAICKGLVECMSGTIRVTSTEGAGSTFEISLPLVVAEYEAEMPTLKAVSRSLAGLRVLAAEDDAVNQMVLELLLEKLDVEFVLARDGFEAIAKWREAPADLILMDCQMPGCDGFEATRTIRAEGGTLPIVAVTANAMPGDRQRCLDAGMDDHLGKPISLAALQATLLRWAPSSERSPHIS